VDERSSSFFDDIEENQILSEAALSGKASHRSDRMGDHLKIEKIEDGQDSSIRDLL
jgi:hypothetical protein